MDSRARLTRLLAESSGRMSPAVAATVALLAEGARVELPVHGDCMRPALVSGDRVLAERRRRVDPGDVVVRLGLGGFAVHRVARTGPHAGSVLLRCDVPLASDEWVSMAHIVGTVIGVRRTAGAMEPIGPAPSTAARLVLRGWRLFCAATCPPAPIAGVDAAWRTRRDADAGGSETGRSGSAGARRPQGREI